MNIPDFNKLRGANASEKGISKNYPDFYQYIMDNYPADLSFAEKIYWYKHGITTYPVCKQCGSRVDYAGSKRGYYQFCSLKCSNSNSEVKSKKEHTILNNFESVDDAYKHRVLKAKQTLIDRYGSAEASYDRRLQKTKQTNLERYGVEYSFQSSELREKGKQTLIDKYGSVEAAYDHRLQKTKQTLIDRYGSVEVAYDHRLQKAKQTNLERYGVENPSQSKDIQDKIKNTCLERYGVEYSFQSNEQKEKTRRTNLKKYGVEYAQQNPDILLKSLNTKKRNQVASHDDILDINFENNQSIYTCKCPHPGCDRCSEKTYSCNSMCYYNRRNNNLEVCTNLLPPQPYRSKGTPLELFVTNILDEYNIEYETNTNSIIPPLELDIYIPSMQLAIECNGMYWHSTFNKPNKYHINKYMLCSDSNIQLLTFWEDQINHVPEIVKSILLSKLGIYTEKIYARKCLIKEVPAKESVEFLKNNHLQGNINSSIRLGLYHNNELVSIMTFGQHRHLLNSQSQENHYELYRLCNKLNTIVIGAASKLLNHFVNTYKPKQITSFASRDISNGKIYKKLGFNEVGSSASYWFIDSKTLNRYHRYKFRKSELLKLGYDSEIDFLKGKKYFKIFDSGQLKFAINY